MSNDNTPTEIRPGVPDWSTVHQPTADIFPLMKDREEWRKLKLTDNLVDQFWRDGCLLNIPVLSQALCDKLLEDYKYFLGEADHPGIDMMYEFHSNQSKDPSNVLMHALGQWRLTKMFHDLIFLPEVVVPSSQLVAESPDQTMLPIRLWTDQLFAKPAYHGGVVCWHQDYSYWTRTIPMRHITVHIALEDQTVENGSIQYIPGSHRWTRDGGKPLPVTDYNFKDMESIKTILTEEENANFKPVNALLKKGEASFHHPLSVHGSYENRTDRPRRAAVLNYFADGTISDTDESMFIDKDIYIPKGTKMEGQFFPLVFDPAWSQQ